MVKLNGELEAERHSTPRALKGLQGAHQVGRQEALCISDHREPILMPVFANSSFAFLFYSFCFLFENMGICV